VLVSAVSAEETRVPPSDTPSFRISSERIFDRTFGIFCSWKYSAVKRAFSSLKWSIVEINSEFKMSGIQYLSRGKPVDKSHERGAGRAKTFQTRMIFESFNPSHDLRRLSSESERHGKE
jgi:hypothetical protein